MTRVDVAIPQRVARAETRSLMRLLAWALALAAACAIPQVAGDYMIGLAILMAIYSIVNMAWNLVFGYAGVFSFGQMAFFGLGAYAAALANLSWGVSPWVDVFVGGFVAAVAGLIVGVPSLRLYGPYMVLFTLVFQLVLAALIPTVWTGVTGGTSGRFGVSSFGIGDLPYLQVTFYAALVLVVLCYALIWFVLRSPIGLSLEVLREGRALAEARGISFLQHRVILFVLSAFLTGIAGGFYVHYVGLITPSVFDLGLLINLLAMLVLGGLSNPVGPIVGTVLGVYLNDKLSTTLQYSQLIWGAILIAVVAIAPGGLVALAGSAARTTTRLLETQLRRRPRGARREGGNEAGA